MKLEDHIEEVATRICDQVASAIERYDSISGGEDLPEHYLQSHVLAGLGDVLTMTMETVSNTLWTWHADMKQRWSKQLGGPLPIKPEAYERTVGGRRADLVVFKGDHTRKNEMDFLCLVEFKKGTLDIWDYEKIKAWLTFLDTCPYGIVCGFCAVSFEQSLEQWKGTVQTSGDTWVHGRVARPLFSDENFQTFARVVKNRGYTHPTA